MDFFGDIAVVKGAAWPVLDIEPRRYRLRLLNGSQSRFYDLWLEDGGQPLPFHVIGTDGGLLSSLAPVTRLPLAPGERADILVDFSSVAAGAVLTLKNDAPAPFPAGGRHIIGEIMQIRVSRPLAGTDETAPAENLALPQFAPLAASPGAPQREIVIVEDADPGAGTAISRST